MPGLNALIDVRVLGLLKLLQLLQLLQLVPIFRILKLGAYVAEFSALGQVLACSQRKVFVVLGFVMLVVPGMGTLMYVLEGPASRCTSIPVGVYWAITAMTTVGLGDTHRTPTSGASSPS